MEKSRDLLRLAAWAYLIGWGLHVFDHLHRGMSAIPMAVMAGGLVQGLVVVIAIAMALTGQPKAPAIAVFTGIAGALLFTYAHLLPSYWPDFQDSFVNGPRIGVTWFSWLTALTEIGTGLFFAYAGWTRLGRSVTAR